MAESIKEWRVYCETEEVYHSVWLDATSSAPTTCPINTGHTITSNLTHDVTSHSLIDRVMIEEEESGRTQGYFKSVCKTIQIDGNVDSVTSLAISWPYKTTLLTGWFYSQQDQVGDYVSAFMAPNTITGYITSDIVSGNNVISVSNTVIENIAVGFDVALTNGVLKSEMGEVLSIDEDNMTITTTENADNSFSYTSPTYFIQTIPIVEDLKINAPGCRFAFAEKKQRGKGVPANTPFVINYINKDGAQKEFSFVVEYMY